MKREHEIYIVRHGKTRANIEGKALGSSSDIPLASEGIIEVETLGQHLQREGVHPKKIYISPLRRAQETAGILQNYIGGDVVLAPELREVNFGTYEGGGKDVLRQIDYGYSTRKMRRDHAETSKKVERRVRPFINKLLKTEDDSFVLVTHGFTASIISQLLEGLPRVFSTIQPLSTADYNYFKVEGANVRRLKVLTRRKFQLKGRLTI